MSFRKEKTKDYFLLDTSVENMFINEYMVSADGDYVKVYLFALMYANLGVDFSNDDIAKQLAMDVEDVLKAWTYWEKMGVIRKIKKSEDNSLEYDVEFILLKDMLYGNHEDAKPISADMGINVQMESDEYRDMFSRIERAAGRVISGSEMSEILSWTTDFDADPQVIAFGFEYCEKSKRKVKYVEAVIRNWMQEGCRTVEEVHELLGAQGERIDNYRRVFKALGFRREPTEEEKRIMDKWLDEMNFSMKIILEACAKTAGITSPNINYVNKVLENWYTEGGVPKKDGDITTGDKIRYYEILQEREAEEAEQRRAEVYSRVPRIKEIENEENELGSQLSRVLVSDRVDKKEAMEQLRETIDTLNMEKVCLLTDNGFEMDYMDIRYQCPHCKDTGMLETGERCECFDTITNEKIKLITNK